MTQGAARRAKIANAAGQGARINAADAWQIIGFQPAIQITCRPPACRIRDGLANDQSQGCRGGGLEILIIGANIANMREGEGNDLPSIGWIG